MKPCLTGAWGFLGSAFNPAEGGQPGPLYRERENCELTLTLSIPVALSWAVFYTELLCTFLFRRKPYLSNARNHCFKCWKDYSRITLLVCSRALERNIGAGCRFYISIIQSCTQPSLLAYKLSLSPLVTGSTNKCHLEPTAESINKWSTLVMANL